MKGINICSQLYLSIHFFVTFPHIFENVVKILTGQKFDISFALEVPFSSSEIKAVLASSGKIPFGKLLFIAFDNVWYKTLEAFFTSLRWIISKPRALRKINISVFVQQKLPGDVIKGIRVLDVFLTHFQPMFYFWKHRKTGGFQGVKKWKSGWICVDTTDAQNDLNTIEQLSLQLVYYQKYYSHKQND